MSVYLSFSLTPVQRFIAAARSVRDLALGSALLTELVGIALTAAQNEGGTPVFPAIRATELPDSIPNQFLVRFDSKVNAERAAERARAAVEACWTDYAQKVHDKLVLGGRADHRGYPLVNRITTRELHGNYTGTALRIDDLFFFVERY